MGKLKKIAVLVSGGGTNLQAIIDAKNDGIIKSGELALVLSSSPDAYALTRAANAGIETCIIDHAKYPDRSEFSQAIADALLARDIDYIVLAGFMYILDAKFSETFANRMINVHPALIPSFCGPGYYGLRVHKAVLASGVKLTGATVHLVNEVCDGGPIIMQKAVEVKEGDTPEILQRRVMEEAEWKILPASLELLCSGRVTVENNIAHIN